MLFTQREIGAMVDLDLNDCSHSVLLRGHLNNDYVVGQNAESLFMPQCEVAKPQTYKLSLLQFPPRTFINRDMWLVSGRTIMRLF